MVATAQPRPQHLSALERANAIRLARAQVKRGLASGAASIRDVLRVHELPDVDTLEDVASEVAGMTIGELLSQPYRWGAARAAKLLDVARVPEHKPLGALTSRQRRAIVALFEGREVETAAEAERRRERNAARIARLRELERARAERAAEAERLALEAEAKVARGPVGVLDVECPSCRSGPGKPCSIYEPVSDHWYEPKRPHGARVKRAAGL